MTTETKTPSVKEQIEKGGMDYPDAKLVEAKDRFKESLLVTSYIMLYFFGVFDFLRPENVDYRFYFNLSLEVLFVVTTYLAWDRGMPGQILKGIIRIHVEYFEWRRTFATMEAGQVVRCLVGFIGISFIVHMLLFMCFALERVGKNVPPVSRILLVYVPFAVLQVYAFWVHFPLLKRFFFA